MKSNKRRVDEVVIILLGILASQLFSFSAFAQGSLTPPGPPAPTMQTLDQLGTKLDSANTGIGTANSGITNANNAITTANAKLDTVAAKLEKRAPISSAPATISQPGSYYLANNVSVTAGDAITINADNVTLDLNGFAITSTTNPAAGTGILINGPRRNVAISNGTIAGSVTFSNNTYSGAGFQYGIFLANGGFNVRVAHLAVSGCLSDGIELSTLTANLVEFCTVDTVGGIGILAAVVSDSSATSTGGHAIDGATVQNCRGSATTQGAGIFADTASNCKGSSGSGFGIYCQGSAANCSGVSSSGYGLRSVCASNCYGSSTSSYGLYATSTAINCWGSSESGTAGLYAYNAAFCTASRSGGTAISATIATGCIATAGTVTATNKYNMP